MRRGWAGLVVAGLMIAARVEAQAPAASSTEAATDAQGEIDTMFREGTDALAGGRAAEAIANLEALGDRGVVDPVVSFDRGLAYAARVRAGLEQPGDLGRAAHGFEEARELSRDAALVADANAALAAVRAEVAKRRSRAGDAIEVESGVSLGRSIVKLLPENVWAILAALAALALSVGVVLRARAQRPRLKVTGTTTAAIAGGLLVACSLVLHSARDIRRHARDAVVVAPSARLLDAQHVAIASMAALPEAARIQLLDETGDFAHVIAGRTEGWLPSSSVLPMAK
ncbi:MAG TPA: hypothetical protein VLT33_27210 [Labilithrix sp.]|nr:hypothetical protein [Labilithrix sp.]